VEDIFDLITGNVKNCVLPSCPKPSEYPGCNKQCLTCPPTTPVPTESHTYIKQTCKGDNEDCTIEFPATDFKCNAIPSGIRGISSECQKYFLFDKISADQDDDDAIGKAAKKNRNKITLYDMCPRQCGSTCPTPPK